MIVITPMPSTAAAAGLSYYVAKSGSDTTGNGSAATPWATIQKAANTVSGGDVVHVGAGTYNERVTIPSTKSGSAGMTTRFVADGAVVVAQGFVVNSSYTDLNGFEITPGVNTGADRVGQIDIAGDYNTVDGVNIHDIGYRSGISLQVGASGNTIRNFSIRGVPMFGITLSNTYNAGSDHTTIRNGTISEHRGWCAIEVAGDYHTIDGVIISGPSGTGSPSHYDGDGIRVNHSTGTTIRNCVIHDLWEYYSDPQHTDCIQLWTEVYGLRIDDCVLGTWEPGPADRPDGSGGYLAQEIGPSQLIMCGTVPANSHVDFTTRNCLYLGQCGTNAAIVTAKSTGASIDIGLYNNTFWSSYPSLNSVDTATLRNNIFRSFYLYPANKSGIDSDYNAYCWVGGSGTNNVPSTEGAHSIGKTYATAVVPKFVNPDITASGGYGWGGASDFSLRADSPAVNAGVAGALVPTGDLAGHDRDAAPDLGAYEYVTETEPPPADTVAPGVALTAPSDGATVSGAVGLAATATDTDSGVARVEFRVDDALVGSDYSAPFAAMWDASDAEEGSHVIRATAIDGAGNSASSTISVTVPPILDTTPPSPVSGLTAVRTGSVALAWTNPATDFATARVLRSTVGFAAAATDSANQVCVYEGAAASYQDVAAPESALYYSVYACDAAGNWSARATAQVAAPGVVAAPLATSLTIGTSVSKVVAGGSVTVRGRLAAAGAPVPNRQDVALWVKVGGRWSFDGMTTYNASSGYYQATRTQRKQTSYQLRFAGDANSSPQLKASTSGVVTVGVSSSVSRVTMSKSIASMGARVALTVTAAAPPLASAKVKRYQLVGKKWKFRGTSRLYAKQVAGSATRYTATMKVKQRGKWRFSAVVIAENGTAKGPFSRVLRVR